MYNISRYTKKTNNLVFIKLCFVIIFILLMFNGRYTYNLILVFNLDVGFAFTLIILIESIAFFYIISNNKIIIDKIAIYLYVQLFVLTMTLIIFPNGINRLKYILAAIESILIYLICSSLPAYKINKFILFISEVSISIISLQTFYVTYSSINKGINYYMLKNYISIPIGETNFIASFLNMFIILVINLEKVKIKRIFFIVLAIIGIICTRSNGGVLLLLLIFLFESCKIIFARKVYIKKIKVIFITFIFIIISLFLINKLSNYFDRYIYLFQSIFKEGMSGIERIANGRIDLYRESFKLCLKYPLFGLGINYSEYVQEIMGESLRITAHNILLDQFLKGGFISLLAFIGYITTLVLKLYKNRKNLIANTILKMIVIVVINGLFEPNLGEFNFDFFFWIFCGIGMANCKIITKTEVIDEV